MKYLDYESLMELAKKNYNNGGAATFECVDETAFQMFFSELTVTDALEMFERDREMGL